MNIIKFLVAEFHNYRITRILKRAIVEDELIAKLSHTFGVQFRTDWIGRIYAVINPAIQDGKFNPDQIFEYTESGPDNTEFIKRWTMERLIVMDSFLKINNLFDILTYDLRKLDEYGNYLLVISPVTLPNVLKYGKYAMYELIGLMIIGATIGKYLITK